MVLLLVVLAGGVAWLSNFLRGQGFDWAAKFSEIASFVLAALALLPVVAGKIAQWVPAPKIKDEQVDYDVNALAAALRAQGRHAAVLPGASVYDRLPMPVRWVPVQEVPETGPGPLRAATAASAHDMTGTFDDVMEFFRQLQEPRLVVLGEAGAGKTVLAVELARCLLAARRGDDPVPVIVPVNAWDPAKTALFDWIAAQLVRINADLAQLVSDGHQILTRAQVLLDRMKVLPILDGLDEVAEASRPMATLAINRYGWSQPLVVTCRYETYLEIIGEQHGTPVARAAVIKLLPLRVADIKGYLGPEVDGRWTVIYERLDAEPHGPLAQALANPLMLWLAGTIYRPPARAADELGDRYRFGSPEGIEHHLLADFVPALYPDGKDRPHWPIWRRQATRRRAERWLGFLASDSPVHSRPLNPRRRKPLDTFETRDIQNVAWWRFTEAAGKLRILGAGFRGALLAAVLWQQVLRILRDSGNWRDGTYVGHVPFRKVFLDGPLGQAVWPTIHRLFQLVPIKTRDHAFVALNNALRDLLSLPSHHLLVVIVIALTVLVFVMFALPESSRPRRVHIRPSALVGWLSDTLQGVLVIAVLMWFVNIFWNHAGNLGVFFNSRATWLTALVLSLVLSVYRWPMRLVSVIDVVGGMKPLQSLRADNLASIFVTVSKRTLFAATVTLVCGSRIALIYLVYAVASTAVGLAFGGLNGFASRAYTDASFWLAISRRLPWRPMPFLIDAERRGVFQEVGAIYRFRHIRVQLELRNWYELNRLRSRDWPLHLVRFLDQFNVYPILPMLQSKAESYRHLARKNLAGFGADLTSVLSDLASALHDLGYRDEELEVRGEIVITLRTIVAANSGMLPPLAAALERFARCLAEAGREHEALGVMSEATGIYGRLAAPEREAFQSRLADWLDKFPSQGGRHKLTRSLMTEMNRLTDLYRDLVLTEPGPNSVGHAQALIRLARVLLRIGRDDEAVAALDEAAEIYRKLIRTRGGTSAEADALRIETHARALVQLAHGFERLEMPHKAADAIADAVQVYRGLACAKPDTYRVLLAGLLTGLADLSRRLGRPQELDAIRAAVLVYRDAAEDNWTHSGPDSLQAEAEKADPAAPSASTDPGKPAKLSLASLSDLSIRLWKLGERDAALDAAQTGRRLAAADGTGNSAVAKPTSWDSVTDPDAPLRLPQPRSRALVWLTAGHQTRVIKAATQWRNVADELDTRALRFLVDGQVHESLAASIEAVRCGQQAVEAYRQLAVTWPSAYLSDLAEALDLLTDYLRKVGSREYEAQDAAREAREIRRRLLGLSP